MAARGGVARSEVSVSKVSIWKAFGPRLSATNRAGVTPKERLVAHSNDQVWRLGSWSLAGFWVEACRLCLDRA